MTISDTACARPGCAGVIDDGYCDQCGRTPFARASAARPATPAPTPASAPAPASAPTPTSAPASVPGRPSGSVAPPASAPAPPPVFRSPAGPAVPSRSAGAGPAIPAQRRGSGHVRRGSGPTSGSGSARGRLGAGLVDVPAVPRVDPATALLADPEVPENHRFCSHCGHPVGRGRDGRPGRTEGFCARDGAAFSFTPKLTPGTLVAGQYDVRGCLAHGGLGWIYLATDRNVNDRWVVLKGLLDSGDASAMAAAVAEKRFLAEVDHPGIVTIHNFVQHGTGSEAVGYIVMEYVGGSSLKQIMEQRRDAQGHLTPMPLRRAIAYALELCPALGYLHERGLAYCDFKPDNVIQYDRRLKLIDLGAVVRFDDRESPIYGTAGYQAPEIASQGVSPASDIYTVGRTLAVLALGVGPASGGKQSAMPADHPVLCRYESFHRLLRRATAPDPAARFGSADEFADQLIGVLREVACLEGEPARPVVSTVFSPPRGTFAAELLDAAAPRRPDPARVAAALPAPLVDPADPAAAQIGTAGRDELVRLVTTAARPGVEVRLALCRAELAAGNRAAAAALLDALADVDPTDWRLDWYRGIAALSGTPESSLDAFDRACTRFPGETVPKLAVAVAAECAGEDARARRYYALVAVSEPGMADAAFGLARTALRAGDRPAAVRALDAVPDTSSRHVTAQLAAIDATLVGRIGVEVGCDALHAVAHRLSTLRLDDATVEQYRASLLAAAVTLVAGRHPGEGQGPPFLGSRWSDRDLRLALERSLRTSATLTSDASRRVELVDRANDARPRTWI